MINFKEFRAELIAEGYNPAFVSGMTDGALELVWRLKYAT